MLVHYIFFKEQISIYNNAVKIDPVPTSFFTMLLDCGVNGVLDIVIHSRSIDVFTDAFKAAVVKPLRKKSSVGHSLLNISS